MKKFICVFVVSMLVTLMFGEPIPHERTEYVVAINSYQLATTDDNTWNTDIELIEGYEYKVVMTDKGTPFNVTDDLIVSIELVKWK